MELCRRVDLISNQDFKFLKLLSFDEIQNKG